MEFLVTGGESHAKAKGGIKSRYATIAWLDPKSVRANCFGRCGNFSGACLVFLLTLPRPAWSSEGIAAPLIGTPYLPSIAANSGSPRVPAAAPRSAHFIRSLQLLYFLVVTLTSATLQRCLWMVKRAPTRPNNIDRDIRPAWTTCAV